MSTPPRFDPVGGHGARVYIQGVMSRHGLHLLYSSTQRSMRLDLQDKGSYSLEKRLGSLIESSEAIVLFFAEPDLEL